MDKESITKEDLDELLKVLPFDISEETASEILEATDELAETTERLAEPTDAKQTPNSSEVVSEDEYGALLETYDNPRQRGGGPLDGLSIAIKDVIAAADLTLTAGSESVHYVPTFDATVVDRLLDAGASIVGKANMDAFAFGPTGEFSEIDTVVNPSVPGRIPGGSSSGSAAAVAGELVDAALGTDTGGSIRIPASCCGVVGIKPTHERVSQYGVAGLAPSTDTTGPIARDIDTASLVLQETSGHDPNDPTSSMIETDTLMGDSLSTNRLKIGLPSAFFDTTNRAVRSFVEQTAETVAGNGVVVEETEFSLGNVDSVYSLLIASEFTWLLQGDFIIRGTGPRHDTKWRHGFSTTRLNDHVAKRVLPAALVDAKTEGQSYTIAQREALELRQRFAEVFEQFDLLLTPTLRTLPPKCDALSTEEDEMMKIVGNTEPLNVTGLPAVSVPIGKINGVPVGAQIIAPWFEEQRLLHGARLVEAAGE